MEKTVLLTNKYFALYFVSVRVCVCELSVSAFRADGSFIVAPKRMAEYNFCAAAVSLFYRHVCVCFASLSL
jgi:hypothetical protein